MDLRAFLPAHGALAAPAGALQALSAGDRTLGTIRDRGACLLARDQYAHLSHLLRACEGLKELLYTR